MKQYGFGVDLGGTTCKLGLFTRDGALLEKWEIPTDVSENGERILPDIARAVEEKLRERSIPKEDAAGIGIGVPGAVRQDGVVNKCINLGWGVVDAAGALGALTGLAVRVANDANVAALGEAWRGAGAGFDSLVMVTLGTGVGGGVILNGKIWNGFHGAAGEIGHIQVNPAEEAVCGCGNRGCLEQYASATGIVRLARKRLGNRSPLVEVTMPQDSPLNPETLTAKDVFDAARAGDALALDVVAESCGFLGRAIATVCNTVNPQAVLIGGGVSRAGDILLSAVKAAFLPAAFHAVRDTEIRFASLGNDAGIYGAVRLILDE